MDSSSSSMTLAAAAVDPIIINIHPVDVDDNNNDNEDVCSICLDAFDSCHNPSTVTKCNHEFHLQCILEWSQRSKECPICWQAIVLKDPASQELLSMVEDERSMRSVADVRHVNEDPEVDHDVEYNDSDFEEQLMRTFEAAATSMRYSSRRNKQRLSGIGPSRVHPRANRQIEQEMYTSLEDFHSLGYASSHDNLDSSSSRSMSSFIDQNSPSVGHQSMAPKKPSSSSSPITIGNCQVVVEAKNYKVESSETTLQIAVSKNVNIVVSVVEDVIGKERNDVEPGVKENEYSFVLVNPKDSDAQSKSLLQEILNLYTKELPSMNYAANTGKKSMFLKRCVSNGKYCSLVLKSKSKEGAGEVIAAISFQIIPADTQYAEVPLAAVSSAYQHKGIGQLTYLEMRKRLHSVGVHSIFCWADEESDGFWFKQGFVTVGQVDTKGRARRLPIKADIRKALCFPGGATLMVSHLQKECSDDSLESFKLSSLIKPLQNSLPDSIDQNQHLDSMDVGCQNFVCLDSLEDINTGYGADEMENITDGDARQCSCSTSGGKKRTWEASKTSLKSKKVKGSHMIACQSDSGCASRMNTTNNCCMDVSLTDVCKDKSSTYFTPAFEGYLSNNCVDKTQEINGYKIMLMNIADDAKKSNLTKIIEDLGGCVTSDGTVSTHVITGKVRKTLNFCTALCSGAWVISPAWLKESFRERRFVEETPYILEDLDYESKYMTDLKGAVLRAKASPGALLKGFEVCLAAHVQPPINTLSAIVRSAGGNVICDVEKAKDLTKTIFVASEDNMEEALTAIQKGIPTFSNEWFMNCVMKQELDLDAPQFAYSLK